ncbi:MAG TPA: ABC transporter ATP-binding protein [Propionibacteriaceae bacterium]|nr:ABC transporter ATP-binding protein [Propionibacteriaceae bacterium]
MSRGDVTLLPIATTRRTWAAVGTLLRDHRGLVAATISMLLASGVAVVFVPALLGRLVDVVRDPEAGVSSVDLVAAGLLVALLARAGFTGVSQFLMSRLGEQVLARLRELVVRRALDTPLATVERAGTGDLVQRTGGDITVISEGIRSALPALAVALIDVGLTLVGLTVLDWRLGLAGLAPLPIWILATRWYLRVSGPRYAAERAADGAQTQSLVTALSGARTVRAFRLQARHEHRIADTSEAAVQAAMRARTAQSQFGAVLNGAEMVGVLAILVAGFLLVRAEAVTLGAATAAAFYFTRLFSPLMGMLFLLDEAQSAGAALARLVGVADLPPPPVPTAPREPHDASVVIEGIRFAYDDGPEVLHGIDLKLTSGERVAVVGTTGAGKTTLGAVVAGVRTPTEGMVRIGGVPLADLAEPRRHVVLVSQEVHVFAGSVADNLRLARPDADDRLLQTALNAVGVDLDLDALVGHGADELSATQAQQLALTRLWLVDPAVAILDEATAEAGSAGARVLEAAAERALRGRTAIVIAHRLTQALSADRVVVMDKGRIVEIGRHAELVAADGPYAALWSAWAGAR